tara:strand:+ start:330 stop:1511 length:1182 start_codon:yes stop_codon:yes gene_type:complete
MGADATLVKGAYEANKYRGQAVDAAQRRLGDSLNEAVGKIAANKRKEEEAEAARKAAANEAAQKVLDTDGQSSNSEDEFYRQHLEEKKQEYLDAKEKGLPTEGIIKDLNTETGLKAGFKEDKIRLASNYVGKSEEGGAQTSGGFGLALDKDPDTKAFLEANIEPEFIKNEEGEIGIVGPDGEFMTREAFTGLQTSFEVDDESFSKITELTTTVKKMGADSNPEDTFDREEASNGIRDVVVNGNMSSLMNDPGFGGTSFVDDLKSGTIYNGGLTYSDLGIERVGDDDIISEDDGLSDDDINGVVDAFVDPKNQDWNVKERQDMVIDYFTTHLERNYNKEHNKVLQKSFSMQPGFQLNSPTISQTLAGRNQSPLNAGVTLPPSDDEISNAEVASI